MYAAPYAEQALSFKTDSFLTCVRSEENNYFLIIF